MTVQTAPPKQNLDQALKALCKLAHERASKRLQEQTEKFREKLEAVTFNLLVLGEFKRGKSTLINSLLGADVLPMATVPLTSVITIIHYAEQAILKISFLGGETKTDRVESLPSYVTERANPHNKKGVQLVYLGYPAKFLEPGIRIVDTPGTGSVYLHNTQTTQDFLPESDGVVFVFVADQPATRNELDLLKESMNYSARQFYVMNKIDHMETDGLQESQSFLQDTLREELGAPCKIYPISASRALQAKLHKEAPAPEFQNLENAISTFALKEKGDALLQSIASKMLALIHETEQLLAIEKHSMELPVARLSECLDKLSMAKIEIARQQQDAEFILRGEINKLVSRVEKDLKPVVEMHDGPLQKQIEQEYETHKDLSKDDLIEHLRTELKRQITKIFDDWRKDENKRIDETFAHLNARFVDKANHVIAEIKSLTSQLFQIEVNTYFEIETLKMQSRHYYAVDNPFMLSMQLMPLLLPDVLSKNIIRGKFVEAAREELSRNSGRLRADYQERLEASSRAFLNNFRKKTVGALEEIESIIKRAIQSAENAKEESATTAATLRQQSENLESARELLQAHR